MKAQRVDMTRHGAMLMMDGAFLCAKCVKGNSRAINEAADDKARSDWQAAGYCGDQVGQYEVNCPEDGDRCSNCDREFIIQ